jgi:hypothetical protein
MKRILLLSSLLLLSAVWAVAQYQSQPSTSSQSSSDNATQTTIQGCLAGSAGSYSLTDKSGTTYQLTGDTAMLQAHVGHTVQVTGTTSSSASSSASTTDKQSSSMSGPSDTQPTIAVTSFKHVSTSCNATP